MNDNLSLHLDYASVLLDGDLDWPRVHEVAHAVETAVEHYLYGLVEIRVRSPGGSNAGLRHLVDRLSVCRERGVRFRVRAVGRTSSAAALLVALGDERVADKGARLLFHGARMYRRGDLDAATCGALHAKLCTADERMIARLVERALAGTSVPPEHSAEDCDREVVEGLCLGATPDPGGTAPARVQTLAAALGQTVDEAIRERDRDSLARIFRRLFELDHPISGKLARTLRLVDRVGAQIGASIAVPASGVLDVSADALPRRTLTHHVLVLGDDVESAGRLCLAPLVTALARAPQSEVGPVLVLDPGPELHQVLETVPSDQRLVLDPESLVLNLMSGRRSLESALKAGQWVSAATSIVQRTLEFVPGSPAKVLLDVSGGVIDPVVREGLSLALSTVAFVLMLTSPIGSRPQGWLPEGDADRRLCRDLIVRALGNDGQPGPSCLALASWLLGVVPGCLPARCADAAKSFSRTGSQEREVHRGLSDGADALSGAGDHARAVLAVAQVVLAPFVGPTTARTIYFGCEPGLEGRDVLDLDTIAAGAGSPRFVVHTPGQGSAGALIATALKQVYFEAVLEGSGRARGDDMPLAGYIARDFEQFATHADLAFLDGARARGAFAVLSSRSVSAIEHALGELPRGECLSAALLAAVGTKLVLRSTDSRTSDLLRPSVPRRPGLPDVLDVRPLGGLAPDECYVSGADGHFKRRRLAHWTEAVPVEAGPDARPKVHYLGPPPTKPEGDPA